MRNGFLHKLGLLLTAGVCAMTAFSQDGEKWVNIYTQDFGGNEVTDPVGPLSTPFTSEQLGDSLYKFTGSTVAIPGAYYVTKQTTSNATWHKGSDHTYPDDVSRGYYFRLDPKPCNSNEVIYVQKIDGVCKGVTFRFTCFMANLNVTDVDAAHLALGIYKDAKGEALVSSSAFKDLRLERSSEAERSSLSLPWKEVTLEFTVPEAIDEVYFIVVAMEPEGQGWDFALDDISVDVKHPIVNIANAQDFEFGTNVDLVADFKNNGFFSSLSNVVYKWYYSPDSINYTEIKSSNYVANPKCSYTITNFNKDVNNGYYRVVIGEGPSFGSEICSIQGDFRVNETLNKKVAHVCHEGVVVVDGHEINAELVNDGDVLDVSSDLVLVISKMVPEIIPVGETSICRNDEYLGKKYPNKGIYYINDTIKSKVYGCDSIYKQTTLEVTDAEVRFEVDTAICQGSTYRGELFDEVGTTAMKKTVGCIDYMRNVVVKPSYNVEKEYYICAGSRCGDQDELFNEGGTFLRTFHYYTTDLHCDSVINATITVADKIVATLPDVEICEGDSYVFDGKTYNTPGIHQLSSVSTSKVSGCDSITNQTLIIHANYSNEFNPIDTLICFGSPLFGTIYEEPTTKPILVKDPHKYYTKTGCDSTVYYSLTVLQMELRLKVKSNRNTICAGEQVEIDVANLKPADALLSWNHIYSGTSMKAIFTPDEDMTYIVLARNEKAGCEATDTVRIYVRDSPVLTIDTVDQKENRVEYHVEGGTLPYSIILDKKEVGDEAVGELLNSFIGSHILSAKDSTGCVSSQKYDIVPIPITPSGFLTPDGDGVSDRWEIENIDVYGKARVRIYARDGRLIQEYNGYENESGWDGYYNGHLMPATDYWYEINLPEIDQQYVGHFTLLYSQK